MTLTLVYSFIHALPAAAKLRYGRVVEECQKKRKKFNDQRAPVTRYEVSCSGRRTLIFG